MAERDDVKHLRDLFRNLRNVMQTSIQHGRRKSIAFDHLEAAEMFAVKAMYRGDEE